MHPLLRGRRWLSCFDQGGGAMEREIFKLWISRLWKVIGIEPVPSSLPRSESQVGDFMFKQVVWFLAVSIVLALRPSWFTESSWYAYPLRFLWIYAFGCYAISTISTRLVGNKSSIDDGGNFSQPLHFLWVESPWLPRLALLFVAGFIPLLSW